MDMLDSVTSTLLGKALDAAMLQHTVIANNIANVNTQGYRPYRVDFQRLLGDMQEDVDGSNGDPTAVIAHLQQMNLDNYVSADEASGRVMLDKEMVSLTKNTIQYQALLTARAKLESIMKTAVKGGS